MKNICYIIFVGVLLMLFSCINEKKPVQDRFLPVPKESGFKMEGYWVWGGSPIKVGTTYYLFVSRWPKKNKFPVGYLTESEIVRATSDSPMGPYKFKELVIGERDSSFWDSNMVHNPTVHKIGDQYVLFYIGSDFATLRPGSNSLVRRIGYATADRIEGPWKRSEKPLIEEESNNPALFVEPDNSIKLVYRDEKLKTKIAVASGFRGPYQLANDNVWDNHLEDFYLFKSDNKYHLVCKDCDGKTFGHFRWFADLVSENGIDNWEKNNPAIISNLDLDLDNGDVIHCERRERPQLLIEQQNVTHIFYAVYDGEDSWCQPVKLNPPYKMN